MRRARLSFIASVALLAGCSRSEAEVRGALPQATTRADGTSEGARENDTTTAPTAVTAAAIVERADVREDVTDAARVYAKGRHVWVRSEPNSGAAWIGYLGLGGAVKTRGEKLRGDGKCKAFQGIEPRGFVCLDEHVSTDARDPQVTAIRRFGPHLDRAWPHSYGVAAETPRYRALPTEPEQRRREWGLDARMRALASVRAGEPRNARIDGLLHEVDTGLSGEEAPRELSSLPVVHEFRDSLKAGSLVSWSETFDAMGRGWLVTGDMVLVPRDQVTVLPQREFHGARVSEGLTFPIAYPTHRARLKYVRDGATNVSATSETWPRFGAIALSGDEVSANGKRFLIARDGGLIDANEATVIRPAAFTPWGEPVDESTGAVDHERARFEGGSRAKSGRGTWVEVSVHGGWMIAYEGTHPVFATLIAAGRGETMGKGDNAFVMSATPPGTFALRGKFWTETLAVTSVVHADVPFVMPYEGSHALHAAYWHDEWGEKVSMGCVNLSPTDARWLFMWAEPEIPEGWHGVTTAGQSDASNATIVVVHG